MATESDLDRNAIFEKSVSSSIDAFDERFSFRFASIKRMHVEVGRKQTEDYQKRLDKLKEEEVRRLFFNHRSLLSLMILVELHGEITLSTSGGSTDAQSNLRTVDDRPGVVCTGERTSFRSRRDLFLSSKNDFDPLSVSMPQHQPISSKVTLLLFDELRQRSSRF